MKTDTGNKPPKRGIKKGEREKHRPINIKGIPEADLLWNLYRKAKFGGLGEEGNYPELTLEKIRELVVKQKVFHNLNGRVIGGLDLSKTEFNPSVYDRINDLIARDIIVDLKKELGIVAAVEA